MADHNSGTASSGGGMQGNADSQKMRRLNGRDKVEEGTLDDQGRWPMEIFRGKPSMEADQEEEDVLEFDLEGALQGSTKNFTP